MGGKEQSIETVLEEAKMVVLLDKDIKSDVMHVLKQLKETILQEPKSKARR